MNVETASGEEEALHACPSFELRALPLAAWCSPVAPPALGIALRRSLALSRPGQSRRHPRAPSRVRIGMTNEERATVEVRRRFQAFPRRVFDAWIETAKIRQWIAAPASGAESVCVDLKPNVGKTFSLVIQRGREETRYSGEYLEIVRPKRLVFTWVMPLISKETTLVSIDFTPVVGPWGGTDLLLKHQRLLPAEAGRTEAWWHGVLDAIEGLVQG